MRKFKMAAIFLKAEKVFRIEQSILHIYPVGQKFHRNRSNSDSLGDTSNFKLPKLKSVYNLLIIGPRGLQCETNL